jgi:two-component system, NarL family, response regulator YdfI
MSSVVASSLRFVSSSMPNESRNGRNQLRQSGGRLKVVLVAASAARRAELDEALTSRATLHIISSFQSLNSLLSAQIPSGVIVFDFSERKSPEVTAREFENLEALLENPALSAVTLIENADRAPVSALINFGNVGIISASSSAHEIEAAIIASAAGLVTLDPEIARQIAERLPQDSHDETDSVEELTRREIEVLKLLARGLGNKEIAAHLGISEHTAKFHISSILGKLAVSSRTEAVTQGLRRGLILL